MFNYDPSVPLDFEILSEQKQRDITLQDITYTSPKGGKVPAYLIIPPKTGPFAHLTFFLFILRGSRVDMFGHGSAPLVFSPLSMVAPMRNRALVL
ncbi:MAG TPA: hypothetical protein VHZ51_13510, partial [Ktedonobacteraceae bacterium]|nr:hypothetical protein [Ktedonobacteraceae bacterium]